MKDVNFKLIITILIVVTGIALRFNVYFQDRSLTYDEANLARNIVEKGYGDLFGSLDYGQYAPPLYLVMVKGLSQSWGVDEFALKLPSLVAGVLSMVLLMLLARKLVGSYPSRWYILLLFAFSILAIRYSTEFKQYGVDLFFSLLFVLWAVNEKEKALDLRSALKWGVGGALAIWMSMPVIFVLAAIGLAFLYRSWRERKSEMPKVVLVGALWTVSFGAYYFLILQSDAHSDYLRNYHQPYFFDFFPKDKEALSQSFYLLISIFRSATDQTLISVLWAIVSFVTGSVILLRKNKYTSFILFMPILLCLIASQFGLYSLIGRLILFMVPLIMLVMGAGIAYFWSKSNLIMKLVLIIPMAISVFNKEGYEYFRNKMEFEDTKGVMTYMEKNRSAGELIYVEHYGIPAFIFYNELYDDAWEFGDYYLAWYTELPAEAIPDKLEDSRHENFWLFFSHTFPQEKIDKNLNSAKEIATELEHYISVQASAYYFSLKEDLSD